MDATKEVVDHEGRVRRVAADSKPGDYPDGWRDLDDVLDAITDDNVRLLLHGMLYEIRTLYGRLNLPAGIEA